MPTKDYINGSNKFKILLIDSTGGTEELDFSFKYTALYEFDQETATRHFYRNGSKTKLMHYVNLVWVIDFSGILFSSDALLLDKVKNAEFDNKIIWLIPHIDVPIRGFKVQIVPDERKLGQYYNIDQSGANKDYVITFENVDAINRYNWVDPDYIPVLMSEDYLIII